MTGSADLYGDTSVSPLPMSKVRVTGQQRALLQAINDAWARPTPTTILYDVQVRYGDMYANCPDPDRLYRIGEPAGAALRRMEKRGLVRSTRGPQSSDWWITDLGREALEAAS